MTRSAARSSAGNGTADEVLDRVLPEPPGDDAAHPPAPPAPPAGVDARRQALLDGMGAPDRESW
jgi:hypothetical protein